MMSYKAINNCLDEVLVGEYTRRMSSPLLFAVFYGAVIAVDQKTGLPVWEAPIPTGRAQLVARKERVYVVSERGSLFVFDAQDGALLKNTPLSGNGQAPTLLVDEEKVFVTCGGELQAFDLEGELLWTNTCAGKGNGAVGMATTNVDRQADEY